MSANRFDDDVGSLLSTALDELDEGVSVVNPSRETISELVTILDGAGPSPDIRMLADEQALKDVMDDFLVASKAADLVEQDLLSMRLLEDPPNHSLLVTDESVLSLVAAGDAISALVADDGAFVADVVDYYEGRWDRADSYSLRTPPISRIQTTLSDSIGPDTAADFDAVLESLQTARGDGDGLDEVSISLLVAARNGELLYDISKWGEDIGLASKATFSRTKTQLEEMGLIDTEKVPIDVGRPRLRLILGDERLENADIDELASVAQSLLAS
ncbi:MAG: transcriptional regulator TbsP [Haloarculaceae archaeon]